MATTDSSIRLSTPNADKGEGYQWKRAGDHCAIVYPSGKKPEAVIESPLPPGALSLAFKDGRPYRARMCVTPQTRGFASKSFKNPRPVGMEIVEASKGRSGIGWDACHLLGKWSGATRIIGLVSNYFNWNIKKKGFEKGFDPRLATLCKNMNLVEGTKALNGSLASRANTANGPSGMTRVERMLWEGLDQGRFDSAQLAVTPLYSSDDDCIPASIVMDVLTTGASEDVDAEYEITNSDELTEAVAKVESEWKSSMGNEMGAEWERCGRFFKDSYLYACPRAEFSEQDPKPWFEGKSVQLERDLPVGLVQDPAYAFFVAWSDGAE